MPDRDEVIRSHLQRALEERKYFAKTNESARKLYGGTPEIQLSARAPQSHANFFKRAVRIIRGLLSQGDPYVKVESENISPETAQAATKHLQSVFSSENFIPSFQMATTDMLMFCAGYGIVTDSRTVDSGYWFDVLLDNAMATPKDVYKGRYIFIRHFDDAEEFWELNKEHLLERGYKTADDLPRPSSLSNHDYGRRIEGVNSMVSLPEQSENKTVYYNKMYGGPSDQLLNYHSANGDLDGLVEWWTVLLRDVVEESGLSTGWSKSHWFDNDILNLRDENGKMVDSVELPYWLKPLSAWFADFMGGQVYQATLYTDMVRSQAAYNFINGKVAQIISMLDFPAWKFALPDKEHVDLFYNTPGEGIGLLEPSAFEPIKQEQPGAQMFTAQQSMKADVEFDSGVNDALSGEQPSADTSGIAIEKLQRSASTYHESYFSGRDEFLGDITRQLLHFWYEDNQEQLPDLDHEIIDNDLGFTFKVIPKLTRDQKMAQNIAASASVQQMLAGTSLEQDPIVRVKLAGVMTGNVDETNEMIEAIQESLQNAPDPQEALVQQEQMAENEHERKLEQIDRQTIGKIAVEDAKPKTEQRERSVNAPKKQR